MHNLGMSIQAVRTPILDTSKNKFTTNDFLDFIKNSLNGMKFEQDTIVCITESLLARAQNNYVTIDDIAEDISKKFYHQITNRSIGLLFPILSRNRFSNILRGICKSGIKKLYIQFDFPKDEVGNSIIDEYDDYDDECKNKVYTYDEFIEKFGKYTHKFTGVNYVDYYKTIIEEYNIQFEFIFSKNPLTIFEYSYNVLICNFRNYEKLYNKLRKQTYNVLTLKDICNTKNDKTGYNEKYGLLGSNKVGEDKLKLFPREIDMNGNRYVELIKNMIESNLNLNTKEHYNINVMIYGDGSYKDPDTEIWELSDPVVCVDYTNGLEGTPNELKIKYIADELATTDKEAVIKNMIKEKDNLKGKMESQGTTPRRYVNLIGSLCDLVSGSGDKGTPIILIHNYFKNYSDDIDKKSKYFIIL